MNKKKHVQIFGKMQITAGIATFCDYLILIFFVEHFHVRPFMAVAIGAFAGAIVNFTLNRYFLYKSNNFLHHELAKYSAVSLGGLSLNTIFMWIFYDFFHFNYLLIKITISIFIALFWNYPLHRYWVFSHNDKSDSCISKAQ